MHARSPAVPMRPRGPGPWIVFLLLTTAFAPLAAAPPTSPPASSPLVLPTYELRLSPADLRRLDGNTGSDETRPAVFVAGGTTYDPVQVRHRGEWARGWPKAPLKIFFERDHRFEGHRSLNLNSGWRDPAFVREALAYHLYEVCGAPASRARPVRLNVNGQFHGFYVEVEQPDGTLLQRCGLAGASLYKTRSGGGAADERDYATVAQCAQNYTNERDADAGVAEVQKFCHDLAQAGDVLDFFNRRVDVPRFVNYLAATALVQHWDWASKNHFLIHDVRHGGKWTLLPWDLDRTLGDHWNNSFNVATLPLLHGTRRSPSVIGWNRFQTRFFEVPELRQKLRARLADLLREEFTPAKLFPLLDRYEAALAVDMPRDRRRWSSPTGDLHAGMVELKGFIIQRRLFLLKEIERL